MSLMSEVGSTLIIFNIMMELVQPGKVDSGVGNKVDSG